MLGAPATQHTRACPYSAQSAAVQAGQVRPPATTPTSRTGTPGYIYGAVGNVRLETDPTPPPPARRTAHPHRHHHRRPLPPPARWRHRRTHRNRHRPQMPDQRRPRHQQPVPVPGQHRPDTHPIFAGERSTVIGPRGRAVVLAPEHNPPKAVRPRRLGLPTGVRMPRDVFAAPCVQKPNSEPPVRLVGCPCPCHVEGRAPHADSGIPGPLPGRNVRR